MTVKELIQKLQTFPQDAEVFYGSMEMYREKDGLPVFALYSFDVVHYPKLRSCRSMLPCANSLKENVVVLEYE